MKRRSPKQRKQKMKGIDGKSRLVKCGSLLLNFPVCISGSLVRI